MMQWFDWHSVVERLKGRLAALTEGLPYDVILSDINDTACCDLISKKIIINPLAFDKSLTTRNPKLRDKTNYLVTRALLGHEVLHARYTDCKAFSSNPLHKDILNILEDERIETIGSYESRVNHELFKFTTNLCAKFQKPFRDLDMTKPESWMYLLLRWRFKMDIPKLNKPEDTVKLNQLISLANHAKYEAYTDGVAQITTRIMDLLGFNNNEEQQASGNLGNSVTDITQTMQGDNNPDENPLSNQEPEDKDQQENDSDESKSDGKKKNSKKKKSSKSGDKDNQDEESSVESKDKSEEQSSSDEDGDQNQTPDKSDESDSGSEKDEEASSESSGSSEEDGDSVDESDEETDDETGDENADSSADSEDDSSEDMDSNSGSNNSDSQEESDTGEDTEGNEDSQEDPEEDLDSNEAQDSEEDPEEDDESDASDADSATDQDENADQADLLTTLADMVENLEATLGDSLDSATDMSDINKTATLSAGYGCSYMDIQPMPYIDIYKEALPIAKYIVKELKLPAPNTTVSSNKYSGRFKSRYYIKNVDRPFAKKQCIGRDVPPTAMSLVVDRSGSMDICEAELRLFMMVFTIACEELRIPLEIRILEGDICLKKFDDWGEYIYARIAGMGCDGGTVMSPTLHSAFESIKTRSELLKQMIIIHDGAPDDSSMVFDQVKRNSDVDLYAVFISKKSMTSDEKTNRKNRLARLFPKSKCEVFEISELGRAWCNYMKVNRSHYMREVK